MAHCRLSPQLGTRESAARRMECWARPGAEGSHRVCFKFCLMGCVVQESKNFRVLFRRTTWSCLYHPQWDFQKCLCVTAWNHRMRRWLDVGVCWHESKGTSVPAMWESAAEALKNLWMLGSHSRPLGSEFLPGPKYSNSSCNVLNGFLKTATLTKKTYITIG